MKKKLYICKSKKNIPSMKNKGMKYVITEETGMSLHEPTSAVGYYHAQSLHTRNIHTPSFEGVTEYMSAHMPCRFTEEELDAEVIAAEKSGFCDHDTFLKTMSAWQ